MKIRIYKRRGGFALGHLDRFGSGYEFDLGFWFVQIFPGRF